MDVKWIDSSYNIICIILVFRATPYMEMGNTISTPTLH